MNPNEATAFQERMYAYISEAGSGLPDAYSDYLWHLIHVQNEADADLGELQEMYNEWEEDMAECSFDQLMAGMDGGQRDMRKPLAPIGFDGIMEFWNRRVGDVVPAMNCDTIENIPLGCCDRDRKGREWWDSDSDRV